MIKRFFFLLFLLVSTNIYPYTRELDSIFAELDKAMASKSMYAEQKEKRITELKKMFNTPNLTPEQRFQINNDLHSEYSYYKPEEAKLFLEENIQIAEELNMSSELILTKLEMARHLSIEGLYLEAAKMMDSIRSKAHEQGLMRNYYSAYKQLYYFYPFPGNNSYHPKYYEYQDSLLAIIDENFSSYSYVIAEKLTDTGKGEEARSILKPLFDKAESGTHRQAMLANVMGKTYQEENNYEMQKKYFAISAIGDVKSAVKEHESFRSLAIACYATNDIDRAYKYISESMEDAIATNFNIRVIEASQFFSIIEKSYQHKLQKEKNRFFYLSILTGIIAFCLVIGILFIYRQMRKLTTIRSNLAVTNKQLKRINHEMRQVNKDLSEANLLKETYITQFLHVCSLYVKKLEKYQSNLNKKAMNHQLDELYKTLKSRDMIENELKEFHELFDKIFLSLYPNFVVEINKLLPVEEQFSLKNKESMTTDLRIFALIRLGITDSSAIAEFLNCSIKTIYNYRTRLRNKSLIHSDEFEDQIKQIDMR